MAQIRHSHFGGNVVLTRDSLTDGDAYHETLEEIDFSNIRFPGGGVTEAQTWENGGLHRMFGKPMDPKDEKYTLTIREMLDFAEKNGKSVSIVTPTFQFYDKVEGHFDTRGFNAYLAELSKAISEYPSVKITNFEIGNEYWGSKEWGSLQPDEYGRIANAEISAINGMINEVWGDRPADDRPGIGIQAGVQWKAEQNADGTWTAVGPRHSQEIINEITTENRALVSAIFQHSYPDANDLTTKINWAINPMRVFQEATGFSDDIQLIISEFNIGENTAVGTQQAAAWINAFSKLIEAGVDAVDHWGISYDWLSNKFYDTKFSPSESDDGAIVTIATPMGQLYDIAERHLIGKSSVKNTEVSDWVEQSGDIQTNGFSEKNQKVVFFYNQTDEDTSIYLSSISSNYHVSTYHIIPADSPYSTWYDESMSKTPLPGQIADARGDMKVVSGPGGTFDSELAPNEIVVVVISDSKRDLFIEGAHNVTDPRTGMVNDAFQGANGNDVLYGHVGNDRIFGSGGKNVIAGGKGNDILLAGDHGDLILSDGGIDNVRGGRGSDMLLFSSAKGRLQSTAVGGAGNDLFIVMPDANVDILDFAPGDLISFGGAFKSKVQLQNATRIAGADLHISMPGGGEVKIAGGSNIMFDLYLYNIDFLQQSERYSLSNRYLKGFSDFQISEAIKLTYEAKFATNFYFENLSRIIDSVGGIGSDLDEDPNVAPLDEGKVVYGSASADQLWGTAHSDKIYGMSGNDKIYGAAGDDELSGNHGHDIVFGGLGDDVIYGGTGFDRLYGGAGNDEINGGDGNDFINGDAGSDRILGGSGQDTIFGGIDSDIVHGGYGSDRIFGGYGSDRLSGNQGNDYVHGGWGNDQIYGGLGSDTLAAAAGNDNLFGGFGDDVLFSGYGDDQSHGGIGNDLIHGQHGNDRLYGEGGNDTLRGGLGNDRLSGGAGIDHLYGGPGRDIFQFKLGDSKPGAFDKVYDFRTGVDIIDLSTIDSNINRPSFQSLKICQRPEANALWFLSEDGGTYVCADVNGDRNADFVIFLPGVTNSDNIDLIF